MKIGMVSEFYYPHPGGVSEHVRSISRELERRGHAVIVITGGMPSGTMEPGPKVCRIGRSLPLRYNGGLSRVTVGIRLRERLRSILREEAFDLLHLHNPLMPTLPLAALEASECPVVGTLHSGYPRDRLSELFRRPLARRLARVRTLLPVSAAALRPVERLFPADYRIVPNGVDLAFFAPARERRGDGICGSPFRVLFVGAVVPRKGLPVLLEACRRLHDLGLSTRLLVAGDGPDLPGVRRGVAARLRPLVRFLGTCDRSSVRDALASADVLCAPSLERESFGMVLLEAMAAGVPVVASDIDGYRDVITHGKDGLLVPPGDPRTLSQALEFLLLDSGLRQRLAARGLQTARRYQWSGIADCLEAIYREAIGHPAASTGPVEREAALFQGVRRPERIAEEA